MTKRKEQQPKYKQSETVVIKRSEINFAPYNPRKEDPEVVKKLKKNFKTVGYLGGIVWNRRSSYLVSGHKRVQTLDIINNYDGTPETDYDIKVEAVDMDDKTEREQNIFMNSPSAMGEFDMEKMRVLVPEIDYQAAGLSEADMNIYGITVMQEEINAGTSSIIGVIKDSTNYFQLWDDMLENKIFPTSFEWWGINISFGFMLICLIGIKIFLYRKSNKHKEGKTIQVKSYSNLSLNSAEQIISSIIPWLTIFADKLDFMVLFVCIILQCCFIAIASYNNNNYNLLCSIWGYRYYEVYTEENTYILISGKCIRNKNEIKKFIEVTDYMGLIINEK